MELVIHVCSNNYINFQMTHEEVRRRKELQMRARLEEREKNRRKGMEKRRKEQAKRRYNSQD